ncbi:hypothetical protein [Gallaecimonas sp. GXIMD1310]|uniref:hypothetical protein n=1 Tax=Gallaecimonas sp. GXIMD1310 TaxID=3131926 RepID=UPI00324EF296
MKRMVMALLLLPAVAQAAPAFIDSGYQLHRQQSGKELLLRLQVNEQQVCPVAAVWFYQRYGQSTLVREQAFARGNAFVVRYQPSAGVHSAELDVQCQAAKGQAPKVYRIRVK